MIGAGKKEKSELSPIVLPIVISFFSASSQGQVVNPYFDTIRGQTDE
jgi:cytochrome c biogenesis protein CcdA